MEQRDPKICIIGAGMSGILMGIRLKLAGFKNFKILESGSTLGGTWRDNTYPGLRCDTPSLSYCYSFEPNFEWTERFPRGEEVSAYFERTAQKYGVLPFIEFNSRVTRACYVEKSWQVETQQGQKFEADFVISACGLLREPNIPKIEGLATFAGNLFHSSRWDHSVALEGQRVGIIGTGSTATQLVSALSSRVKQLKLFQRTPQWIYPGFNRPYTFLDRFLARHLPLYQRYCRWFWDWMFDQVALAVIKKGWRRFFYQSVCRLHLFKIKSKELRNKLKPNYEPLCKRLILSGEFYPAIQRENVALVTESIDRIERNGVRTKDGTLHNLDVLVLATGFQSELYLRPMEVIGRNSVALNDLWKDGVKAYHSVALPGFPNFFMLIGPNSPVGNFSFVAIAELQANFILRWLTEYRVGKINSIEPRQEALDSFHSKLKAAMQGTVWLTGCQSWYIGSDGIPGSWPWTPQKFRECMASPDLKDFSIS